MGSVMQRLDEHHGIVMLDRCSSKLFEVTLMS
jgi:hypothetical protein